MKSLTKTYHVCALVVLGCTCAIAQEYTLEWFTVDGGGGTSSGGEYSLSGSIGQPATGRMSGGDYTVEGGFWPGMLVVPSDEAPTLTIQRAPGGLQIQWMPATPGFVLESCDDLNAPEWQPASSNNPVVVPVEGAARFYRLHRP